MCILNCNFVFVTINYNGNVLFIFSVGKSAFYTVDIFKGTGVTYTINENELSFILINHLSCFFKHKCEIFAGNEEFVGSGLLVGQRKHFEDVHLKSGKFR